MIVRDKRRILGLLLTKRSRHTHDHALASQILGEVDLGARRVFEQRGGGNGITDFDHFECCRCVEWAHSRGDCGETWDRSIDKASSTKHEGGERMSRRLRELMGVGKN